MENFEQLLRKHIEDMGSNIYQFAKISKINRVNIQRYISGQRLPSLEVLEQMVQKLHLNQEELERLIESYRIRDIGEKVYFQRKYVKHILEASFYAFQQKNNYPRYSSHLVSEDIPAYMPIQGKASVLNFIHHAINRVVAMEKAELDMFLPPMEELPKQILPSYEIDRKYVFQNLKVRQLLQLTKKAEDQQSGFYNLSIFKSVIPLCFSAGDGYQVYYYYSNMTSEVGEGFLYPYYIVLSDQIFLLSRNMESAIAISDQDMICQYREKFNRQIEVSRPLVSYMDTLTDLVTKWVRFEKDATVRYAVEYQPCLFTWGDEELLDGVIRKDIPGVEQIKQMMLMRFQQLKPDLFACHYFTRKGIEEFAATGTVADFPPQFATPFTPEQRIILLDRIIESASQPPHAIRIINDQKFKTEKMIPLYMSDTMGVDMTLYDIDTGIRCIRADESTIYDAFVDFVESMEEEGMVMSWEETLKVLRGCRENVGNLVK